MLDNLAFSPFFLNETMNFHISYTNNNRFVELLALLLSAFRKRFFENRTQDPLAGESGDRRTALNFEKFSSKFSVYFPEHPTLRRVAHWVGHLRSYDRLASVPKWVCGSRRLPALSPIIFGWVRFRGNAPRSPKG